MAIGNHGHSFVGETELTVSSGWQLAARLVGGEKETVAKLTVGNNSSWIFSITPTEGKEPLCSASYISEEYRQSPTFSPHHILTACTMLHYADKFNFRATESQTPISPTDP